MPLARFVPLTTAGSAIWNAALIGAGYVLGANWERVSGWIGRYSRVVLVAAAVTAGVYLPLRELRSRRTKG